MPATAAVPPAKPPAQPAQPACPTHPARVPHRPQVDVPQRLPRRAALCQAGLHPFCSIPVAPRSGSNPCQRGGRWRQRKGAACLRPRPVLQLQRQGGGEELLVRVGMDEVVDAGSARTAGRQSVHLKSGQPTAKVRDGICTGQILQHGFTRMLAAWLGGSSCRGLLRESHTATHLLRVEEHTLRTSGELHTASWQRTTSKSGSLSSPARRRWCALWCASAASSFSRSTAAAYQGSRPAWFIAPALGGCGRQASHSQVHVEHLQGTMAVAGSHYNYPIGWCMRMQQPASSDGPLLCSPVAPGGSTHLTLSTRRSSPPSSPSSYATACRPLALSNSTTCSQGRGAEAGLGAGARGRRHQVLPPLEGAAASTLCPRLLQEACVPMRACHAHTCCALITTVCLTSPE